MVMTRKQKEEKVAELKKLIDDHSVVCILNMHKMPARQMFQIKRNLEDKASIRMAKKTLIQMAFKGSKVEALLDKIIQSPSIMFTNDNPFKLYKYLKDNKSNAAAKAGDITPEDIVIKAGATDLDPGPAIAQLQGVGLKTSIENGKISVLKDQIVLKSGEEVTRELANVFSALKMEPMKIGLDLVAAYEDGILYEKDVLDIDEEQYAQDLNKAITDALNLSVNAGFLTKTTAPIAISQAFREAKALALEAGVLDKSIIGELLAKATSEAKALEDAAPDINKVEDTTEKTVTEETKNGNDSKEGSEDSKKTSDKEDSKVGEKTSDTQEASEDADEKKEESK